MAVMTNDAPAMEGIFRSLLPRLITNLAYLLVMGFVIIRSQHHLLMLIAFAMVPFYIFFPSAVATRFRKAFRSVQESHANISANLQESISSTRDVIAFTMEDWDEKRLSGLFTEELNQKLRAVILEARFGGIQNLANHVSPFLVLVVGAVAVLRGDITVGFLLAFQQWTTSFYSNAAGLYHTYQDMQKSLGAVERVFEFLDEPVDPIRLTGSRTLPMVKGHLMFDNVSFSYDKEEMVLHSVTFELEPGMIGALVGPSGSGKSTIMNLILRFFDPDEGRIFLDGVDLRDLDVSWLRRQMGVVFQDLFLFNGSLFDNVVFGKPEATPQDVYRAAKAANLEEIVQKLPDGYDTNLGERGVRLSGGQKQRVAIARAIIREPKILLLDEATSAQDPVSEENISRAIWDQLKEKTSLVIAHRLSTVVNADRIIFLKNGRPVEIGTHKELVKMGGDYASFYELEFEKRLTKDVV